MNVRRGLPRDLRAIGAIDALAREQRARRAFLRAALRAKQCWVAERERSLLGYVVLDRSFYGQPFVALLFVRDAARRQRVGTALLREAEAHCPTSRLFTSTNQSNQAMQRLLASLGWAPSGVILNLDPADPELVYVRVLEDAR